MSSATEEIAEDVERNLVAFREAAEKHRGLAFREMELEATRGLVKSEAIRRIMEQENPDTGKPHSASSAEKIVESDSAYAAHLKAQRQTVFEKNAAWAQVEVARLRVRLGIALVHAEVGT